VRVVTTLFVALMLCCTTSVPADAGGRSAPLAVAQAAFKAARATNGATTTSQELEHAALIANDNVAIFPDGYVSAINKSLSGDHGVALLVIVPRGGFGCVHISPSITIPPTSVRCPAPYLFVFDPNPKASPEFLLATQVAGAIGLEASYVSNAKSGSARSSEVTKILKLVSGVSATRNNLQWSVTVRSESVCLAFTARGTFSVRSGACA
jgi:hypothetical protein